MFESRVALLATFFDLPNKRSIPGHDTIRRVLSALSPKQFPEALFKLTKGLHEVMRGEVIAIDGKTLRGTCEKDGHGGLHLVTAWASEMGLISMRATHDRTQPSKSPFLESVRQTIRRRHLPYGTEK